MLPVGTCASELAGVVERRAYRMRGQTLQQQRGGFRDDGRFGRHRHEGRDRLLPSAVLLDGVLLSPMPETGVAVEGLARFGLELELVIDLLTDACGVVLG